ncbi:MAG TPA: hypothetical protein VL492_05040 [Methylovirgula sp.]|nr:hypothetical protein [Methylovirgula sp.]
MPRSTLIFALAAWTAAGLACPASADSASTDLCASLAASYKTLMTGPAGPKGFYRESPLALLAAKPSSGVSIAPHVAEVGKHPSPQQWAQQQKLSLTPQVKQALDKSDFVDQVPGGNYYAASRVEGTLSCYASSFFTVADGAATDTREPPNWSQEDGDSCGTYRVFGKVGAAPVAFDESYDYSGLLVSTLSVSRWAGDRFAPACNITFHYVPRFAADQQFNPWQESCTAKNCGTLRQAALALTEELQADPSGTEAERLGKLTDQQRAAYQAMKAGANVKPPEKPDDPLDFSESTPATVPLLVDGQLYLAEIGHQTIGWRSYSDWDVKLFASDGKTPVARIAIGMTKGPLGNVDIN